MTSEWSRVGQFARARRKDLKRTQSDIARTGGPSPALQRQVETGRYEAEMQAAMRTAWEKALRWAPGSIGDILAGGEPTELEPAEEVSELEARFMRVLERHPIERIFGEWDAAYTALIRTEAEYAKARGIDRRFAFDELYETWRMWHDGLEGRPWTPPWAPQDETFVALYGEGAKPWLREWWSRQEMSDEPWVTLRMKKVQNELLRGGDGDVDDSGDSAPTSVPLAALDDHEDRPDDPHD